MDTVKFKGKDYDVVYAHHRVQELVDGNIVINAKGGLTEAYIKEENTEKKGEDIKILSEYAHCSHKDTYNKVLGRKIAFTRLVDRISGKLDEREAKRAAWRT